MHKIQILSFKVRVGKKYVILYPLKSLLLGIMAPIQMIGNFVFVCIESLKFTERWKH
jgi:hypothetical protein